MFKFSIKKMIAGATACIAMGALATSAMATSSTVFTGGGTLNLYGSNYSSTNFPQVAPSGTISKISYKWQLNRQASKLTVKLCAGTNCTTVLNNGSAISGTGSTTIFNGLPASQIFHFEFKTTTGSTGSVISPSLYQLQHSLTMTY
ncbi:flagellar protein FlhE [Asticcacaulis benevestitus]|uniref:Spore coat protein U domain-containing protein n=1 Tax=Asticcacaulis benevestitus DSM 16100 = ATCC BAA-896 TaxID=1121022 RepID=V4PYM6_9CAUL|nr:flagellar protein FlhE [Asticcacaulis benevestitus]ESQ92544.1 hypothetical protein ABENE_07865 [Asticcacaulis benevestitus DSM 16100 = ATCC BAA-896]